MNWLQHIIKRGGPPELQVLGNRLLLAGGSIVGYFYLGSDVRVLWTLLGYFALNTALFVMQQMGIWKQEKRWAAAIILDATLAFAIMHLAPQHMSAFYPVLLWLILSNGFRLGIKWLLISSILATLSFGAVVITTTYWQQNIQLGAALTIGLLAIPAYCSTLIRSISAAKEEIDLASKAKSYFLASVSHELRTPLNAIIGYGNHLRQSNLPRGQKDMVEASVLAGEHLLHLIEQLIDVAKAGTGKAVVQRGSFRATDLLAEIRDIMVGRIEEKGLILHLQAEPMSDNMVDAPVNVIRNILLNLVGNAVKFTEAGSITISCGFVTRNDQTTLSFAVSDTGIGIADSAKERIFQPFQQADDTVMNRFGGTGLGLSICKQLAEQVDGDISVESQIGQGSVFRINIPAHTIAGPSQFDDIDADAQINILSVGPIPVDLLANAQAQENFNVRHFDCENRAALTATLRQIELQKFQVILVPEYLAKDIPGDDQLWTILANAEIGPILVTESEIITSGGYMPEFTSVLKPNAGYPDIRSAVKICGAFARGIRSSGIEVEEEVKKYTSKKVLVADDNRTNRNLLAAILEAAGHHVTMATDGDEALLELEKGETDIMLLDVNMPRLGGVETCIIWRQSEAGKSRLPIIGVTADATMETESRCLEAGMDLRITKPVDSKLLLSKIEEYCAETGQRDMSQTTQDAQPDNIVVPISREAPQTVDVIDHTQIDYLRSIGDQAFINTMIEGFSEDIEQTMEQLRRAVKTENASEFRFCAHAFKSSGHNMGAASLSRSCAQLEKVSDAEFSEHRHLYLAQLEQEISNAMNALNADIYTGAVASMAKAI